MFDAQERLNLIVRAQHGAFSRAQARSCGFSARMIKRRVDQGDWELLHPRVLTLPSIPPSWHRDISAACLWGFPAFASGIAAGFLYDLPLDHDPPVEILTLNRKLVPHAGIKVHVTARLPEEHRSAIDGIPVTSIERTLMDLCARLPRRRAAIALDNALLRGLTTLGGVDHFLQVAARRGRNGCGILRSMIKDRIGLETPPTSPLETVIYEMLVESRLPMPRLQFTIRGPRGRFIARPDFVYPQQKLIIEGHSKLWHWGQRAESEDLQRHNGLLAAGYSVMYVTWKDATTDRDRTITAIARILGEAA